MLWYILAGFYLVLWLLLLVHCLRRRRFYPLLGPGWGTKGLWLVTFLFLNPLLTLMYLVFGFLVKPKERHGQLGFVRPASFGILVLIGLIIICFEMPTGASSAGPEVFNKGQRTDGRDDFKFEVQAGALKASNNISTTTSSTKSQYAKFAGRTVTVSCDQDDELLARAGRNLAKALSQIGHVEKVEYFPSGTSAEVGGRASDIAIRLSAPSRKEFCTPVGRKLEATFVMEAGDTLYNGPSTEWHSLSPPLVGFDMRSTLQHSSVTQGYGARSARYKQQAESIAVQFAEAIKKQFATWADDCGLMGRMPEIMYGRYEEAPQFAFLEGRNPQLAMSQCGLMKKNHTIWLYEDNRPTGEALLSVMNELEAEGWAAGDRNIDSASSSGSEYLRMTRGDDERVYLFRQRPTDAQTGREIYHKPGEAPDIPDTPMVLHYERYFAEEQAEAVRRYLLEDDAEVDTLLLFSGLFRNDARKAFASRLEAEKGDSFDAQLYLAGYWAGLGEAEKAKTALICARALAQTVRAHNPGDDEIKRLAKKLGDEDLAKLPIGTQVFEDLGFINIEEVSNGTEITKEMGQSLVFYSINADSTTKTWTLRTFRDVGFDEPVHFKFQDIRKEDCSSSYGEQGPFSVADAKWQEHKSYEINGKRLDLSVERTEDVKFRYEIRVHYGAQ